MQRVGGLVKSRSSKAVALAGGLAVMALGLGACGSDDDSESAEPRPPISVATAKQLASLSEEIATDLDAGDTCTAAARADDLADAIESARIDGRLRPGIEEVATELVNQVNCPPPPEPEKKDEEKKDEEKEDDEKGKEGEGEGESYEDAKLPGVESLPPGQRKQSEERFE
jgi:hypothetical protein